MVSRFGVINRSTSSASSASWRLLGSPGGLPGASWGAPGGPPGASWGLLGASEGLLAASGGLLERTWSLVGLMLGFLNLIWALQGVNFWHDEAQCSLPSLVGPSIPRVVSLRERPRVISLLRPCVSLSTSNGCCVSSLCGFRHLTPKLACSLLHRSAYNQGSLGIYNPCRRRHLALLSSVASRWM